MRREKGANLRTLFYNTRLAEGKFTIISMQVIGRRPYPDIRSWFIHIVSIMIKYYASPADRKPEKDGPGYRLTNKRD
jgi:hypothetical protein